MWGIHYLIKHNLKTEHTMTIPLMFVDLKNCDVHKSVSLFICAISIMSNLPVLFKNPIEIASYSIEWFLFIGIWENEVVTTIELL